MILLRSLPALLVALVLVACASVAGLREKPVFELVGAEVLKFTLAEQRLALRVAVRNPNDAELPLDAVEFELFLNDLPFATGVSRQPLRVAAQGDGVLDLVAESDLSRAAGVWKQLREQPRESRSRVRYRLKGIAQAGPYGRVPFDRSGEIDLKSDSFRRKRD